ncbi:MAG TPA: MBL fold metallo-hydrolase [Candidatus Solibacter sp.]|nr:MBL fold metallo-hydrolase [Candidatus Solibacter sp.]
MKRLLTMTVFCILLLLALYRNAASEVNLVREIAPGVFVRLAEPEKKIIANAGWVVFRDYVLVIDANYPWGARAILADLRKTTDKPIRFVFDTHYHADHAFGNSLYVDAGATIVCSEDCMAESHRKNTVAWAGDKGEGEFDLNQWRLEHPQAAFVDRMVFDDGRQRVELTKVGPGHTLGDAIAYLPKERILFTGDLCLTRAGNNIADPDADPENWVKALDRLNQLDVGILIPGHGPLGNHESILPQRKYLAALIDGVKAGVGRGQSADAIAESLDLTSFHPNGEDLARNQVSIKAVYAKLKK